MTLYISDLDGTLLGSSGTLKPRTTDMLNDFIAKGAAFSYCTARSLFSAEKIMADLRLNMPVILMNGVFIYDTVKGEYIVKNFPDREEIGLIRETARRLGGTPMVHAIIDGEIRISYFPDSPKNRKYLAARKGDKRLRPVETYEALFEGEVFYAVFLSPDNAEALDEIFLSGHGFSRTCYIDVYDRNQIWYEVFSSRAGKNNAVLQLKKITGADEIVAFGDNGNDLPMFSVSDRCYAVGNAIDEVKAVADGVIGSNDSYGVPEFMEKELFPVFYYEPPEKAVDEERFAMAVEKANARKATTIGTLNEKAIHNALKCYYGGDIDHEAKIGSFYADIAGEKGITEIQTGSFGKLNKKLSEMLRACHVTVVYPFEKIVNSYSVNEKTGELISSSKRENKDLSKLFLELYRIKGFLTNPNLTICIAELEISKTAYYKDNRRIRYRGMRREKTPVKLLNEIRLEKKADYGVFLPEGLNGRFTKKELSVVCKPTDSSLLLEILEFTGVVKRVGKEGNAIVYEKV